MRVSIRFQILAVTSATLLVALAAHLLLATRLFTADKVADIYDLESSLTATVSEEVRANVEARVDKLAYFATQTQDPTAAARALLASDPDLLSVEVWRRDGPGLALERRTEDPARLAALGLDPAELAESRRRTPIPLEALPAEGPMLLNASLPPDVALLALAAPLPERGSVVVAWLRPDRLLRIFRTAAAYRVYLVDGRGSVLVHPEPRRVVERESALATPIVREAVEGAVARAVHELDGPGGGTIAAFARVGVGRLSVIAEVPRAEALRAARQLVKRSLLFGLGILFLAVVASIAVARPITAPLRRLEEATGSIARGEYSIRVPVRSRNELGRLAEAFNRMGQELADRERRLDEAQAQLVQSVKLSVLGEISASLAHEVKNPLAGVVGYAQLGRRDGPPEAQELFKLIEENAWRANEIVVGLLKFARDERLEGERLDPGALARDTLRLLRHELQQRQVQAELSVAEGLPRVWANGNQIQQVLLNLVINAMHAMEGRPERRLAVRVAAEPGAVAFTVGDTGVGMTAEVQGRIFAPFFTTKPAGTGTGLGLSVSLRIVKQHGGTIDVESEPGRGSTFTVRIPIGEPPGTWDERPASATG